MKIFIERFSYSVTDSRSYGKNNLLIFVLVLIGLMVIFAYGVGNVSAASGDSIYVNGSSGNDAYNGLNSTWTGGLNGPKATIKNATGTITTNGTVYIASGTYKENNIQININMNIIGENQNNTIINGQQSGNPIFTIASEVNITIINLTLTNNTADYGGAIYNDGGTLTVDNSTFTNNTASIGGGAIYSDGGTLTVDNSTFTNNTADYGGAIYSDGGTLTVDNSTFTNNTASYYSGAIWNYGGTLTVDNSNFTGNTASYYSGAIWNYGGTLTVDNSNFTNNTASIGGGAICNDGGTLTVENSTFTKNTASYYGGAIFNNGALTVDNSTFTNNTAGYGGAIYNSGTLTVDNSTFTNNTAISSGGAICNYGTAVVSYNQIIGNTATYGGAIYNDYGGTVDARYNWWGSNTNPYTNISGSGVTYGPWMVLTVTSNPATIDVYGKSTITADLLHDSNGVYHDPINGHVPDGITVNFSSDTKGTVNPTSTLTTNGTVNTTFTGLLPRVSVVSTNVDAQTVTNNVNINPISTSMIVISASGLNGKNVNLIATLTDCDSNPISGANIQFNVNGVSVGTANTDSKGIATLPYIITQNSGTYTILANYLGNDTYTASSNTNNLHVTNTPTSMIVISASGLNGKNVNLIATLTDSDANPIGGANVQFSINGIHVGTATTDSKGIATLPYIITQNSGTYTILANYLGNNIYTASSNTNNLHVTNTPTAKASPTGGLYNTTKTVTLTMNEPGKIYYTINGTTPTNTSKLYTGPFTIKSTTTLKYLAVNKMGNKSIVYSAIYTIDKTAPKASVNVKSGLYNTNKTIKLSMNEKGTIYYTLTGKTPTTTGKKYTGPITIKSTTTLKYLAVDLAGNKSPIYTNKYTIDKTAPKVVSTKPKNNSKGVSLTTSIIIKFSEKLTKTTNFSKIYIKNMNTGKITHTTTKLSGNTITIKMIRSRLSLDNYQVYIPTKAVKDTAGNNNKKYIINFKTRIY